MHLFGFPFLFFLPKIASSTHPTESATLVLQFYATRCLTPLLVDTVHDFG